ncbi:MAG TPA: hypothetical protein VGN72_15645 [Tepidisphaeraceae bacterium]|jgi:hypothetical protein|nr:hypothetical protein [Tepidisphaeraceae bacterium]
MSPIDMTNASTAEQVTALAAELFEPGDVVEVRRQPVRRYQPTSRWIKARALATAVPALLDDNRSGLDIYFGANPRTGVGQRSAPGVTLARAMMLDFDHVSDLSAVRATLADVAIEHEGERAVLAPPTAIVNSGHGFWVWWRLVEPMEELYVRTMAFDLLMTKAVAQARLNELADAKRHAEAVEAAKAKMAARRAAGVNDDTANVIDAFNARHDVQELLEAHGYLFVPRGGTRGETFIRPGSSSQMNGHVVTCGDGRRRSIHFSTADPLNDGKFRKGIRCGTRDAFDVFLKLQHNGQMTPTVRAAAVLVGKAYKVEPDAAVLARIVDSPDAEVLRVAIWESPTLSDAECHRIVREAIARHTGFDKQVDRLASQLLAITSAQNLTGGAR